MKQQHIKYLGLFFMVVPMSVIMALVGALRTHGFCANLPVQFLKSWSIMFPVAYIAAFLFFPTAKKLTARCEKSIKKQNPEYEQKG